MLPEKQIKLLYEKIGNTIKTLREEKGFKQMTFAELLKISRASLVNIEQGRQKAPLHNLFEIARLLGVSVYEIVPKDLPDDREDVPEVSDKIEKQINETSGGNTEIQQKLMEFVKQIKTTK